MCLLLHAKYGPDWQMVVGIGASQSSEFGQNCDMLVVLYPADTTLDTDTGYIGREGKNVVLRAKVMPCPSLYSLHFSPLPSPLYPSVSFPLLFSSYLPFPSFFALPTSLPFSAFLNACLLPSPLFPFSFPSLFSHPPSHHLHPHSFLSFLLLSYFRPLLYP